MVRVPVEVREGDDLFEVVVYADSISQAVSMARGRFPGHDARVAFPIDGEEFFGAGGTEGSGGRTSAGRGFRLTGFRRQAWTVCEGATIHRSQSRGRQVDA
jgi:hypothetical protein